MLVPAHVDLSDANVDLLGAGGVERDKQRGTGMGSGGEAIAGAGNV